MSTKDSEEHQAVENRNISSGSSADIFYIPDDLLDSDCASLYQLRHPHTQTGCVFLINDTKKKIYEMSSFDEVHRSWIIDNSVHSKGRVLMAIEFNPVYLILPYLMKTTRRVPLDQLLEDEEFPNMVLLSNLEVNLYCVADRKGDPDLNVWCYNEESTLAFLKERTTELALKLQKNREHIPQGFSALVKGWDEDIPQESYLVLAFGMISELLEETLEKKLAAFLNLPDKTRKSENIPTPQPKKFKASAPNEVHSNILANNKPKILETAKSKALAKSAAGTRSITNFFQKK